MTTPPVPSITDEQLAELEALADAAVANPGGYEDSEEEFEFMSQIRPMNIAGLIARLRAAEADAKRMGTALSQIMAQVDGNIRPTVRDIINGMPDANYIYDYCDQIDRIALEAMEPKP